jgi:hypothetical protein
MAKWVNNRMLGKGTMRASLWLIALVASVGGTLLAGGGAGAQLLITGNDEKVSFDPNTGKTVPPR